MVSRSPASSPTTNTRHHDRRGHQRFHSTQSTRFITFNMSAEFLIAHASDPHFSSGSDQRNPTHKHSIAILQELTKELLQRKAAMDLLIVSGDLSNYGDAESLIKVHSWIFREMPIGNGEYLGLGLPKEKVGLIPGNHDAWNAPLASKWVDRRQRSIENFNRQFPEHRVPDTGCYYDWLEREGEGVYIAYVDTCYLGDHEEHLRSKPPSRDGHSIARGKVTIAQSERLLELHDRGIKGNLDDPRKEGQSIDG